MQFEKTYTREFFQRLQIALVLWTRAILIVFEKLTRACFFQIALETILLPIQIAQICYIQYTHRTRQLKLGGIEISTGIPLKSFKEMCDLQ